jgi:hypothetical protein
MDMDRVSKWMAGAALLMLLLLCWWSPPFGDSDRDRRSFMIECQDDGMKHYQCVSLWNGAGLAVFRRRDMAPLEMN